jgi:hypothetical protein
MFNFIHALLQCDYSPDLQFRSNDWRQGRAGLKVSDQLNHRLLAIVAGKAGMRHNFLEESPNIGVAVAR